MKYLVLAGSSVEAGLGDAVVDVVIAELAGVARSALTLEAVVHVHAGGGAGGVAQVGRALVDGGLAGQAHEARSAVAHERLVHTLGGTI